MRNRRGSDDRFSLRSRAIVVATRMVEELGADALNVRALARALETGSASLYYHFADKDALLAEVSAQGFGLLSRALADAVREPRVVPALQAACSCYLRFMRDHPARYQLMFDDHLLRDQPAARDAEHSAFQAFVLALAADGDLEGEDVALALWALGRGTAALCISTGDPRGPNSMQVAQGIVRGLERLLGHRVRGISRDPIEPPT